MGIAAASILLDLPALAAPLPQTNSPVNLNSQQTTLVTAIMPSARITSVSPVYGTGDNNVTIKGLGLSAVTAVRFGGANAASFTIVDENTIKAQAPINGPAGSTVPVSAISGAVVPTKATFSYQIGQMEVDGPLPLAVGYVGDAGWASGQGHLMSASPPQTLAFITATPVLHVSTSFADDSASYPQGTIDPKTGIATYKQNLTIYELVGNTADYTVVLQMCSLNGVPSFGTSDTHQSCINFDNNAGTWVNLASQSGTLNWPGSGKTTFGDIQVPLGLAFDEENTVRTFRLEMTMAEMDTRSAAKLGNYRQATGYSSPFNVVIAPEALIQLSVIPYTILYQPPGNQSSVSFTTTAMYGTNYALSDSKDQSNTTGESEKLQQKSGLSLAYFLGFSVDGSENWDSTTQSTFGTTNASTNGGSSGLTFTSTWTAPAPNPALVPGSGDTCITATDCSSTKPDPDIWSKEPFWLDRFILFVHPQYAAWVLGGQNDRYVMYGAAPVTAIAFVGQLHACATGQQLWGAGDPCEIDYTDADLESSHGQIVYHGSADSIEIDKDEATNLLALDPFYSGGQGVDLPVTRAILLPGGGSYGTAFQSPVNSITKSLSNAQQTQQGATAAQTSATTMSGYAGSDFSIGENFAYSGGGLNAKANIITLDNSVQYSGSSSIKTVYTDSTAVSNQQVTTATVTLNDYDDTTPGNSGPICKTCHDPLRKPPSVNIYLDRLFGSFMFQDPAAPATTTNRLIALCRAPLLRVYSAAEQSMQRFSDVPGDAPAHTAIGLLARMHLLTGDATGAFHPNDPLSQDDLKTILTKTASFRSAVATRAAPPAASMPGTTTTVASLPAAATPTNAVIARAPSTVAMKASVSRQAFATSLVSDFKMPATAVNALQKTGAVTRAEAAQILVDALNAQQARYDATTPACKMGTAAPR